MDALYRKLAWTPEFQRLSVYGRSLASPKSVDIMSELKGDNHVIQKRLYGDQIPEWVRSVFKLPIAAVQVFGAKPGSVSLFHKDGKDRKAAFNIPISGCDLGTQEWSEPSFTEVLIQGSYTSIRLAKEEKLNSDFRLNVPMRATLTLDQPTLVNTDEWHRVNNSANPNYRFVLSVRFENNPPFSDVYSSLG